MKTISIFGATGSVGRNTLEVIRESRKKFKVVGLSCQKNISLLEAYVKEFSPEFVSISDRESAKEFLDLAVGKRVDVFSGEDGLLKMAQKRADIYIMAITGFSSLLPTLEIIKAGGVIGLASKEALVVAGKLLIKESKKKGAKILPLDSEPNALFQALSNASRKVERVYLTGSGGSLYKKRGKITYQKVLSHPVWKMGRKITVDSADLMNKGFEVIETSYLFSLPSERIEVLIHPEVIIHAIVQFSDGFSFAVCASPDMKFPINYVLNYPEDGPPLFHSLDWSSLSSLTFKKVRENRFPCLSLARESLNTGGTMPAVLNGANDISVQAFLDKKLSFYRIPEVIKEVVKRHKLIPSPSLSEILKASKWAEEEARRLIK